MNNLETLLHEIISNLGAPLAALEAGESPPALRLRRSARLPVLAALHARLKRPILLITDRADHALTILDELGLWAAHAPRLLFPEPTALFYEKAAWADTTRRDRLAVLNALAAYHLPGGTAAEASQPPAPIIVAPARAVMARTLPRRDYLKAARLLRPGLAVAPDELARAWVLLGYEAVNTVIAPGQFSRRGGILDVWPPASPFPARIEFFGDEIETLRSFDPASQRTTGALPRLMAAPAREFILSGDPSTWPEEPAEYLIPLLHPLPSTLLDFLPRQALTLVDDSQACQDIALEIEEQTVKLRQDAAADGSLPDDYPLPYLSWSEILDSLSQRQAMELGGMGEEREEDGLAQEFTPGPRFAGRLKPFTEHLLECSQRGEQTFVVSRQASRLDELWKEHTLLLSPQSAPAPVFIEGTLAEGFILLNASGRRFPLFTDGEIFGWRRPEPRQRPRALAESPEAAYTDLQAGDYVVHVDHGVGCFVGLVSRTIDSIEREYLCIEYASQAQLFVPVHQADRVTRYIGADGRPPALSHLGGQEWKTVKAHVKEAAQEVAEDLLDLYARRNMVEGHAFSPDVHWQQELEASFPYVETDDQMRVLAEVKRDMERPRPMDRLICGDVGYGKTEVALRAAFKAVLDGKQVAVLVPTTVLAQQHYQTFRQRLAAFPAEVEMLSRFRNPQEQRQIVERLEKGGLDIVIGTHRLLSADVRFKDLGLLIIDEEQRFGVAHKEALKKIRTEVDVLTLTATPIPRTLYMTLTGVRDISTINTPPEERLPIITHVGPYSPRLARQAILRELERGGQVFFVHNRVQTISAMRSHLEKLVPEARITVAHGQMPEDALSERMKQFTNGEVDILLSTSIIESGLDIPNANTLIVDRADTFGLAQLYQLRGRVGRGAQRAYSYFFRHARKAPTLEGRERLETIAENTQLGAGFSIAMRDLEIRGAGEILGARQHGHIAAVGFHLYTRLLAEAVRRLRPGHAALAALDKQRLPPAAPANVDLPLPASIPVEYVSEKVMRLRLYRRMADIQSQIELNALAAEFKDRFGPLPEPVDNLLYQLKVRLLAESAGLSSVSGENGQIVLRYPENTVPEGLPGLGPAVRVGKSALWITTAGLADWKEALLDTLSRLENRASQPTGGEARQ
ncbi:MAG: transcription-repair coupling factor [Chloroflexi bacterium]|nr:transcription-repair coupling factor [Chloroflexota bacterium]